MRRRRWPRRAAWAAALVAVAAVAAVLARGPIAEAAIAGWAAANGLPAARARVAVLGLHRAVLTDVAAGTAASADRIEATYDLSPPWRPRLLRLTIDGAVVDLDAAAALADAVPAGGSGSGGPAAVPAVTVNRAVLRVATPRGALDLAVDGTLEPAADGALRADFRLAAGGRLGDLEGRLTGGGTAAAGWRGTLAAQLSKAGAARGRADAELAFTADALTLRATVSAIEAALRGEVALSVRDVLSSPVATIDAAATADASAPLWRDLDLGVRRGTVEARLRGDGLRPAAADGAIGALDAHLAVADVAADAASVRRASLDLPLRLRRDGDAYGAALAAPGRAAVDGLVAGAARLAEPVAIALTPGTGPLLRVAADGAVAGSVQLAPGPVAVAVTRADSTPLLVRAAPGTIRLDRRADGRIVAALTGASLTVPDHDVSAAGIAAAVDTGGVPARLTIDALRLGAVPVGLAATATAGRDGARLTLQAEVTHPQHGRIAAATGRHDPAAGRGQATVAVGPLAFRPDGLQPADVAAALGTLEGVGGTAQLDLALAWGEGAGGGSARLRLDDIAIAGGPVAVDGLTADLRLESLAPPRTPPGQTIAVRSIGGDSGLRDAKLDFAIEPAAGGDVRLAIAGGGGAFADGRVTVLPGEILAGAPRNTLTVGFDRVGIAPLFALLDVDGVSGTGVASGTVPVTFADGGIAVAGGRLTAAPDGVIRIRSEAVNRALAGGGEPVRLMLQALEDFRYERLTLDIDKAADGEARLLLSTQGHNPAVLEGHPFALNITLSGNADRLLATVLEAYSVSDRALQGLLRAKP